ncbi:MAG: peroxiredoxin [Betaproteobacteria bacterium]|nr:peroxiredoxin [Betaproteobacteria bacterium]
MNSHPGKSRSKLAILLWAATPERPELCATPFLHATAAAALDCEVEIHFGGSAARLLIAGEAERLFAGGKPIDAFMREAANLGVRFIGCAMALQAHVREGETYIPEYTASASITDFVLRTLDPEWATLVF